MKRKCPYIYSCNGIHALTDDEDLSILNFTAKTAYKYSMQRNPSHSLDTGENGIRHSTVTDESCILLVTCCHGNPWFA